MSDQYCTLGNFPPENTWGVFGSGTCPDLAGNFIPKHCYHQYDDAPGVFHLLMEVKETFLELSISPNPELIYPSYEEILAWNNGGRESWKERSQK